jgi:hypothetical protein
VETLATRILRDGPLNELDAVGWAIRLAKRIEALHALGVAHGAISPECVLTTAVDRTSKAILADLRQTPSRIAYQSPERVGGGTLSAGDDVWAIAATLYEVLTGASAFGGGSDAETRQRISSSSPAPLAVFDVGDDDLQRVLDDAFQRDRSARTTNAAAFRRALEEWHPDPAVRTLLPLDDEDATNDEDDDEVRTLMRVSPFSSSQLDEVIAQRAAAAAAGQPAPPLPAERARPPAAQPGASAPRAGAAPIPRAPAAAPAAQGRAPVARARVPGVGAVPVTQTSGDAREGSEPRMATREATPLNFRGPAGPAAAAPARSGGAAPAAHRAPDAGRPAPGAAPAAGGPREPPAVAAPAPAFPGRERPDAEPEAVARPQPRSGELPFLGDLDGDMLDEPTLDAPTVVDDRDDDDDDDVPTRTREAPTPVVPPLVDATPTLGAPQALADAATGRSAAAPLERAAGAPAAASSTRADAGGGALLGPTSGAAGALSPSQQASAATHGAVAAQQSAAPAQRAAQGSAAPAPSPLGAADGLGLITDVPPDRSGRLGIIIAVVVALLLAGGAMLFAAQLGLLGAAPTAPGRGVVEPVPALAVAPIVARSRPDRLLVEALDLRVEAAHVHAQERLGPEA